MREPVRKALAELFSPSYALPVAAVAFFYGAVSVLVLWRMGSGTGMVLLALALSFLFSLIGDLLNTWISTGLRRRLFLRALLSGLGSPDALLVSGSLKEIEELVGLMVNALMAGVRLVSRRLLVFLVVTVYLAFHDPSLLLWYVSIMLSAFVAGAALAVRLPSLYMDVAHHSSAVMAAESEVHSGYRAMVASSWERHAASLVMEPYARYVTAAAWVSVLHTAISSMVTLILFGAAAYLVSLGVSDELGKVVGLSYGAMAGMVHDLGSIRGVLSARFPHSLFDEPPGRRRPERTVTLEDVAFAWTDTLLFESVSLTLERGRVVAITGPNGAGKTTLAMVAAGLLRPSAGRVMVDGEEALPVAGFQDQTGSVFSSSIEFNIAPDGGGVDEGYPHGLPLPAPDTPATSLSRGQKKCVALLRAFGAPTPLVILDEPEAYLDERTAERAAAFIDGHRQERMILMITHEPVFLAISDEVYVLEDGTLRPQTRDM